MNENQLMSTPSYLDAKRKLVKEKLARRIQHDREDQNYANKNRAALAGATGVIVLLSVFAFGILEIDVGLPMVNKGFQHAIEGTHTTGNDLANAATMAAVDMDPASAETSQDTPGPEEFIVTANEPPSEEDATEESVAAAAEEPEEQEDAGETQDGAAQNKDEEPEDEETQPTPAPDGAPAAPVEETPFVVIEDGATPQQPSEQYLQEVVPEEKGMFTPGSEGEGDASAEATATNTTDTQEETPDKGVLGSVLSVFSSKKKPAADTDKAPKKNVNSYPECNNTVITKSDSEIDFMSQKVKGASIFTEPFASAMYACSFWPEALYARMNYYFPPEQVFEKLKTKEKQKKCGKGGCHQIFKMDTLKKADNATVGNWPKFTKAKKLWEKVESIVFNKRFEKTVFDQLKVDDKQVKKRQIHFLSDKHGYTDGTVQTNRGELGEKLATMQFFIINNTAAAKDYGVCTHTEKQYKERQTTKTSPRKVKVGKGEQEIGVGEAACDKMFRFMPNSAVAFKTGAKAYHSVPNYFTKHHLHVDRNVIVVDWYK
mmetsp:Transcript_9822/g.20453  ORF Transcript_9822/g.20453 Transcript_9822/m.20453 type:complete len:543 (-) Transcript_9822:86-1714(-)|eukprot:CAMPEP_0118934646 /NCGR_PEP_ID=MMETSP1169-20130426/13939_1 /TAXON_ID=36882 /ORGANISM="Pyramimonas obovata, Strain CCMP722" /LENGTH=542 /DNA_ID=CAMNT_0006877571 /DNA_START=266 /DNA_END=1894 /DNA_ORIENTATION=+